jgi:hypothetical protein
MNPRVGGEGGEGRADGGWLVCAWMAGGLNSIQRGFSGLAADM